MILIINVRIPVSCNVDATVDLIVVVAIVTNLLSGFDVTVDVLEHQWQPLPVPEIEVFNRDPPLVRPVVLGTIIWIDPLRLEGMENIIGHSFESEIASPSRGEKLNS